MSKLKKTSDIPISKFQRYRLAKSRKGMKLLRIWVSDTKRPEFAAEAARQGALLRGRPEEKDALEFIAVAFEWPEN
jgi:Protein  of unknown function (DUF3018)